MFSLLNLEAKDFGTYPFSDGGGGLMLDEPLSSIPYLSVFIPHFIGKPEDNQEILRKLYLDFDLSSYQIAEITEWSRVSVSNFLRQEGLTKNTRKSPTPKFGERIIGGFRIANQSEQKIIQKIVSLRSDGTSFREIAKTLNNSGISTKKGNTWSKTTVQDIYKREQENQK